MEGDAFWEERKFSIFNAQVIFKTEIHLKIEHISPKGRYGSNSSLLKILQLAANSLQLFSLSGQRLSPNFPHGKDFARTVAEP